MLTMCLNRWHCRIQGCYGVIASACHASPPPPHALDNGQRYADTILFQFCVVVGLYQPHLGSKGDQLADGDRLRTGSNRISRGLAVLPAVRTLILRSGESLALWGSTLDSQRVFTKVVLPVPEAPEDTVRDLFDVIHRLE